MSGDKRVSNIKRDGEPPLQLILLGATITPDVHVPYQY